MGFDKAKYRVETIPLAECQEMVARFHYSGGGSNTAVFRHGLFRLGLPKPVGCAWWIPPTKNAAKATWPSNWRAVLALHRLVVAPYVPTNGASYLIGRSIRLIRQDRRWECLVTYADESQGHAGTIYQATNWEYCGVTSSEAQWVDPETGRFVARKAGPRTRTKAEMEELGYKMIGRFKKHKYRMVL